MKHRAPSTSTPPRMRSRHRGLFTTHFWGASAVPSFEPAGWHDMHSRFFFCVGEFMRPRCLGGAGAPCTEHLGDMWHPCSRSHVYSIRTQRLILSILRRVECFVGWSAVSLGCSPRAYSVSCTPTTDGVRRAYARPKYLEFSSS